MRFCSLTVVFVFGSFLGVLKNKAWGTSGVGYDFWLEADMIWALAMSIHRVKWRHSPWSRHVRRVCCWARSRSPLYRSTLTYPALHGSAPPYLASSFTCVADIPHRRRLRSASTEQLDVPTCRRSTIGGRAFPVAGAKVWNGLPRDVTSTSSLSVFKNLVTTPSPFCGYNTI